MALAMFVVLFALVTVARPGVIPSGRHVYAAPVYGGPAEYTQRVVYAQPGRLQGAAIIKGQPVLTKANDEYDFHPQYKFGYDVQDSISGDSKRQVESRNGDVVQGEYSLIDADGYKRRVQYTADSVNGFNAIVTRERVNGFVKAVVAPVVLKTAVPMAYSAASLPVKYTNAPKQLYRSAAAAYENGPVVKGAYAETPIVKAVPVAYPISREH